MDLDVGVEPELDPLSLYLPLPYRVASILVLGMLHSNDMFFELDRAADS
jgi:hypothetical protein